MDFEITILGSSSATPVYHRHPTAQTVQVHERFFLIDCGEGALIQMNKFKIRFHKINHIFISHLHGDHYLGLMGLLSTMHLQGRVNELHIFSPPGLQEIVEIQLKYSDTRLRFPVSFHVLDTAISSVIYKDELLQVTTIPLDHRIPCSGFMIEELPRPRKILKEFIERFDLSIAQMQQLKSGADIMLDDGRMIANSEATVAPPAPRRYAYCSDTIYNENLIQQIKGVDLLYHEATFLDDLADRAKETYHTTALQAGRIARLSEVKKLIIGHFSARYKNLQPLLEEALQEFALTSLAIEGESFQI